MFISRSILIFILPVLFFPFTTYAEQHEEAVGHRPVDSIPVEVQRQIAIITDGNYRERNAATLEIVKLFNKDKPTADSAFRELARILGKPETSLEVKRRFETYMRDWSIPSDLVVHKRSDWWKTIIQKYLNKWQESDPAKKEVDVAGKLRQEMIKNAEEINKLQDKISSLTQIVAVGADIDDVKLTLQKEYKAKLQKLYLKIINDMKFDTVGNLPQFGETDFLDIKATKDGQVFQFKLGGPKVRVRQVQDQEPYDPVKVPVSLADVMTTTQLIRLEKQNIARENVLQLDSPTVMMDCAQDSVAPIFYERFENVPLKVQTHLGAIFPEVNEIIGIRYF